MTELQNYQTTKETASTDGLADFFGSSDKHSQDTPDSQVIGCDSVEADSDSQDKTVSVQEAARYLGISPRTVLRRLNKGALNGYKVEGTFGVEWRVRLDSFDKYSQGALDSQVISLDSLDRHSQDSPGTSEESLILELREQISILRAELSCERIEGQRQLQAAVFRNGYLEAQLESKDREIRLLTDNQKSKATWLQRAWSWFIGKN